MVTDTLAIQNRTIAGINWYAEGLVMDKNNNPLQPYINLVWNATDIPVDPNFTPVQLTATGFYQAWTDHSPYEISVLFTLKGYKSKKVQISELINYPNVVLEKEDSIPYVQLALVLAAIAIISKKTGKVSGFGTGDVSTIFLLVGGVIAFTLIEKILKTLGIWGGGNVAAEEADPNSAWKPTYWKEFSSFTYVISEQDAKSYASTIYNAFTLFQDDYNAVKGALSQMKTKANVSYLAYVFQSQYDEDLLSFLTNGGGILPWDGLSATHMDTLIDMVKQLPTN